MASFTLAIANIQLADAQRVEFIVQFGTSESDSANDVFADSSGDVYVVGFTQGTLPDQTSEGTPNSDAFIRKYNSDGDEVWTWQFGTSDGSTADDVFADSSGDVYVVGFTVGTLPDQTSEGDQDAFIRKYDADGEEIWTRQFGASGRDRATGVSADSSGGVYVGGGAGGAFDGETEEIFDLFVRKYDAEGDEIWTRHFGTSEIDTARRVSADSSGGVYMVGNTEGTFPDQTSEGDQNAFLAKFVDDNDKRKKH